MPNFERRAADIRASAPPGTFMFNIEGAVGATMLIEDAIAALKRRHDARKLRKYGLQPDQMLVLPPEVTVPVAMGLPAEGAAQLIWTERASRAGAHVARTEQTISHSGGTTELTYSQLTPGVAREVDRVMRHSTDPHDRT